MPMTCSTCSNGPERTDPATPGRPSFFQAGQAATLLAGEMLRECNVRPAPACSLATALRVR